jgi:hypothetical protein
LSRPCSSCEHPQAGEINKLALGGTSVSHLSKQFFPLSEASLGRHLRAGHHQVGILQEARAAGMATTDLLEVITGALADVTAARAAALAAGNGTALVRAAMASQNIALGLLDRLGVTDLEIVAGLREGQQLAEAISYVARRDTEAGRAVQARLRHVGASEMVTALEQLLTTAEANHERGIES